MNKSMLTKGSRTTVFAGSKPGQRMMHGVRTPPSYTEVRPLRNGALEATSSSGLRGPTQAPLSEASMSNVRSDIPLVSSCRKTLPTPASSAVITER